MFIVFFSEKLASLIYLKGPDSESVMAMWGREVVEKAFFVDPDIAKAETLPSYAFEDPDVLSSS